MSQAIRLIGSECRSKIDYRRRKLALTRAATIAQRSGENLSAYHCRDCHGWHIGHMPGEPRRLEQVAT